MTAVKKCTVCDDERKGQNYEYGYGYGYGSASCETPSIWQDVDIADYKILGINKVFICNMCANKNSVPYSTRLRVTRNTLDILAFFFVISWVAGLIAIIKPSLLNNTFINVGPIFLSIDAEPIIIVSVITVLSCFIIGYILFPLMKDLTEMKKNRIEIFAFQLNKQSHKEELQKEATSQYPDSKIPSDFRVFTSRARDKIDILKSEAKEAHFDVKISSKKPNVLKYCRAYSWPNNIDRDSLTKDIYRNARAKVSNLDIPCSFVIFLAYEIKELPFFAIAIDMDFSEVLDSEISKDIDRFIDQIKDESPQSLENPGWFHHINKDYKIGLANNGVTVLDGYYVDFASKGIDRIEEISKSDDFQKLISLAKNKELTIKMQGGGYSVLKEGEQIRFCALQKQLEEFITKYNT